MSSLPNDSFGASNMPTHSFPNPNVQRNRVPGKAELLRLQALVNTNSRIMRLLDGEIEQLRASYDGIHSRYIDLQMELEATQSELHQASELLATVKNQRLALQIQQDDLRALMHPIRRCPEEILREVFLLTIRGMVHNSVIMRQSVRLSSVCQRWRTVALETPKLWSDITFRLSRPWRNQDFLRDNILPRLKQNQARVGIYTIDSSSTSVLRECGLQDIPVIGTLTLKVSIPGDVQYILSPSFCAPTGTLNALHIYAKAPLGPPEAHLDLPRFDILRLVARFPRFRKLEIQGLPNLTLPVASTNSNLTELKFSDLEQLDILLLLQCFPKLESMTIRRTALLGDQTHPIRHIPSIKLICLIDTTGETWMECVFFPNLASLQSHHTAAFRDFISRHPSIKELVEPVLVGGAIAVYAALAMHLETVHVAPPLEGLYRSREGASHMSFPSLKHLSINTFTPGDLTLEDFEAAVRARCLPLRHPQSQAIQPSSVAETLVIRTYGSEVVGEPPAWHASDLYKESTKKVDERHPNETHLSWLGLELKW